MRDTTLEGKTVISSEDCFCVPLLYCRRTFGFSHSKYKEPHHEAWLSNILFPMKSTLKVTSHDNDSATLTAWRMKNHFFNFNLLQEALSKALKPAFHFYQRHPAFKTTTTNKHCVKLCWNATPQFCCHTTVFYNTVLWHRDCSTSEGTWLWDHMRQKWSWGSRQSSFPNSQGFHKGATSSCLTCAQSN